MSKFDREYKHYKSGPLKGWRKWSNFPIIDRVALIVSIISLVAVIAKRI